MHALATIRVGPIDTAFVKHPAACVGGSIPVLEAQASDIEKAIDATIDFQQQPSDEKDQQHDANRRTLHIHGQQCISPLADSDTNT